MDKKYLYDKNCIAFFKEKATSDFWDSHWETENLEQIVRNCKTHWFTDFAKKYLPVGSKVLEGGCGRGQIVNSLMYNGFDATGIDFAEKTVEAVNIAVPELDIRVGDVFNLKFEDNVFDGYISGGVIEHFWKGYDEILSEMSRVIKPGGYLFITVPVMSQLRIMKAKLGLYSKAISDEVDPINFYQFALDHKSLLSDLNDKGFEIKESRFIDAVKGIKDEIFLLKPLFQLIYDNKLPQSNRIMNVINKLFSKLAGHLIFLVMQKR